MREGITVEVSAADCARLEATVADRNSPQKWVWRAKIILVTADGWSPDLTGNKGVFGMPELIAFVA